MRSVFLVLGLAASTCLAADVPVSPVSLAEWLLFDKPVVLNCVKHEPSARKKRRPDPFGTPIWAYAYSSNTQTLHSYSIALYSGGTLFGDRRKQLEAMIGEQAGKLDGRLADRDVGIAIQTRPDGRQVFFTVLGFGPGGMAYAAFTRLPRGTYDLLVTHDVDFEDDMRQEQKLHDPAQPGKDLRDVFALIEDAVRATLETSDTRKEAAPRPPADPQR